MGKEGEFSVCPHGATAVSLRAALVFFTVRSEISEAPAKTTGA
jgi:hypothetical protein